MIQLVEVSDEVLLSEGEVRLLVRSVALLELQVEAFPLLVVVFAVVLVLLDCIDLLLGGIHAESLLESERIYLLENGFEGDERLLKNLVPVLISEFCYHRDKHGEGLVLVGLQNVQEVVVFEEAHCAVGYLQVDTADAAHNSLEEAGNEVFNFIDLAHLQHLLELCQEQSLFDAVSERPVSQKSFEQRDCESAIFGQEQHGAAKELLVELGASLDLVEGDDHILEEYYVLVTERHCESTNNTCENI